MEKNEFQKVHFCTRYWDENGGNPERRPYWDEVTDRGGGKVQRVFISALWFPNWKRWKEEADRALAAALTRYDAFSGTFEKYGTSYTIAGEPHYLLEKDDIWGDSYTIWINALCPNAEQFDSTIEAAKQKISDTLTGTTRLGARVSDLYDRALPMLEHPSAWCQAQVGTVGDSFRR